MSLHLFNRRLSNVSIPSYGVLSTFRHSENVLHFLIGT